VNREPTIGAIEGMTFPNSGKPHLETILGSIPRIDLGDDALSLDLIANHIEDHAARQTENRLFQALDPCLPCPKLRSSNTRTQFSGAHSTSSLEAQLQKSLVLRDRLALSRLRTRNYTSSVLSLCLSLSKLSLKSLDRLRCALVLDLSIQAAYKKLIAVCTDCHNGIRLIEINSNRMNSINIRKFNCIGHITNNLVSEILDYDTINFGGITKCIFECFRNRITKVLPTINRRNAQETVLSKTSISAPLSNKEKSEWPMPIEG